MFIMKKKLYDSYMEFLFPILFETQKRVDMTDYDGYQKRLFGFLSEILLYVYVVQNGLKVKEAQVGLLSEKAETRELKEALAQYFKEQDVQGAKACFMEHYRKRPDILMEVSDLNGECRLAMQAISSMEWEQDKTGRCRLEEMTDFHEIIDIYRHLNELAAAYGKENDTLEKLLAAIQCVPDGATIKMWLLQNHISETEYQIARKVQNM
jgi:hypothetical protein